MNKDDLIKTSKELTTKIKSLEKNAETARDDGAITPEQFLKAKDEWEKLETKALELKGLIDKIDLGKIMNPGVDSAFSNIINATKKLENAAKKIENVGNVLTEIANVVNVVTIAINAIK